ncbi:MAG: Clp protease ClpP [Mogibacterium sp.]|nr:Clp protease ClpP [Mogibacterium sp.]
MVKFWNLVQNGDAAELHFYGEIADSSWTGDEVTPQQLQRDISRMSSSGTVDIYINSPGGDVFAGLSIYNMVRRLKKNVTVHIDGLAASAASVIAMAGDRIIMPKNAMMMIHNAWSFTAGNAEELRTMASRLERVDGQLAQIYADRTGRPIEEIRGMMAAETWMNGEEAYAARFADEVEDNKRIAACANMSEILARYHHAPVMDLAEEPDPEEEATPEEPEAEEKEEEQAEEAEALPADDNGGDGQPAAEQGEVEARQRRFSIATKTLNMEVQNESE